MWRRCAGTGCHGKYVIVHVMRMRRIVKFELYWLLHVQISPVSSVGALRLWLVDEGISECTDFICCGVLTHLTNKAASLFTDNLCHACLQSRVYTCRQLLRTPKGPDCSFSFSTRMAFSYGLCMYTIMY